MADPTILQEPKGTPVFRRLIADFIDVGTTEPDIHLMNVFETLDESPNAQTQDISFTNDKNTTTITTGFQTQISLSGRIFKDNVVTDFLVNIAEEQQLGVQFPYYRVRLYQPIAGKQDTYYARKFTMEYAPDTIGGDGGDVATVEGNLNAQGDVIVGEFNTKTRTFTPRDDADSEQPTPTLGTLTVTSAAGTETGKTAVIVSPALTSGNAYHYQTGTSLSLPAYDADVSGMASWDGTAELTAATGQQLLIVEATAAGKARAAGIATV